MLLDSINGFTYDFLYKLKESEEALMSCCEVNLFESYLYSQMSMEQGSFSSILKLVLEFYFLIFKIWEGLEAGICRLVLHLGFLAIR